MNCLECFNRPWFDGLQIVCSPFLFFCRRATFAPLWCLDGIRHGVLPRMHICARLVPSMASGMEYCHGCTFAPAGALVGIRYGVLPPCHVCARWCPRWHQAWSIATDAHLRPSWCPRWHQAWSIATDAHLRPSWCPRWHQVWSIATDAHLRPLVPSPSCYTHYSKSQILEFLQRCPHSRGSL